VQEPIITLSEAHLTSLQTEISDLDNTAKRALFAERVEKPVFFDTAFNYIDMPMDELLVLAGKEKRTEQDVGAEKGAVEIVKEVAGGAIEEAKKAVVGVRGSREATPGGEDVGVGKGKVGGGEKPKGWLGGWFGRG
jgi:signal recognition particle subunit SRP68